MAEPVVSKVILTQVEDLSARQQAELGMTGRAVIEVSKNSPLRKDVKKLDGTYTDYFEAKFAETSLSKDELQNLCRQF